MAGIMYMYNVVLWAGKLEEIRTNCMELREIEDLYGCEGLKM